MLLLPRFAFSESFCFFLEAACPSVRLQSSAQTYGLMLMPVLLEFPFCAVLSSVASNIPLKVVNN